ncbi:hypothetical protein BT96DRAFT_991250 [Gymnopus androsaceus JB14]|uniref:Uncharacterized protein n=1 Tax=Gymnopus androsaceus JB14 TaxID=1447944 RepID=A0A6A4HZ99_9AGAR|nr:hypothetical protein BT96DRAFT_991250 [Gymnopus androsaceus JB14]
MSLPSREHTQHTSIPERRPRSSRTGRLNVITDEDMVRITPQARIPPELALIDRTLEELEADEPDWDLPWRCDVMGMPAKKRARVTPSSSQSSSSSTSIFPMSPDYRFSSSPPSSSSTPALSVLSWPAGLTVARLSEGFNSIFDDASSLLSPQRRFEMEFGHAWNPDDFYLHYEIWRAMPEEDKAAGAFLTMDWISYVQSRDFVL